MTSTSGRLVTVEDSERTKITYTPPNLWKLNEQCVGCNITNAAARARLASVASASA